MTATEIQMNRAYKIAVDGAITEVTPANGKDFALKELYEIVGCEMVEIIPLADGRLMALDEEGKIFYKPHNPLATAIAYGSIFEEDYIVGAALVCRADQIL